MVAVNTYLLSCAYSKLKYIAVTGGALCLGEVENYRGKLIFTSSSFEVSIMKLSEFFEHIQQLGENIIALPCPPSLLGNNSPQAGSSKGTACRNPGTSKTVSGTKNEESAKEEEDEDSAEKTG